MYTLGQGGLKDEAEAARWHRLAADQGLAGAQLNLGFMYDNGRGGLKDEAEAVRWHRLAADHLERDMTRAEVSRATELARVCMASDYQDCEL